jgi:imidazolonepropionase-like amidohydrolase
MSATVVHASRILTPEEDLTDSIIVIEEGRIAAMGHRDEMRVPPGANDFVAAGMTIVP